jgi:hypothetical protein
VQTLAVGLLGLGAVAAVVPLGAKAGQPDAAAAPAADATPAPAPKPVETAKIDLDPPSVAVFLNAVAGPVKNGPVDPTPPDPEPAAAPQLAGLDACKYLGGIISDTYKRAIISLASGEQRILGVGQKFKPDSANPNVADAEVLEIDRTFVKVKQGETEHTISLAPRQKTEVVVLDAAAAARATNNGGGAGSAQQYRGAANGGQLNPSPSSRLRELERMKMDAKARGDSKMAESLESDINDAAKAAKYEKGDKGQK